MDLQAQWQSHVLGPPSSQYVVTQCGVNQGNESGHSASAHEPNHWTSDDVGYMRIDHAEAESAQAKSGFRPPHLNSTNTAILRFVFASIATIAPMGGSDTKNNSSAAALAVIQHITHDFICISERQLTQ